MRLAVITDEISPDLGTALGVCAELGVRTADLRVVGDESVVLAGAAEVAAIRALLERAGVAVAAISSPFLKCDLWAESDADGPVARAQWDLFERSLAVAQALGAPVVRAFSCWRVADPAAARPAILAALDTAARRATAAGLRLALENEHTCNVATGVETRWYLDRLPALSVLWDPGNEAAFGSAPFPAGYDAVRGRVAHVHVKDVAADGTFTRAGAGTIPYADQVRALAADGYDGALTVETHHDLDGSRVAATRAALLALRDLCAQAGVALA